MEKQMSPYQSVRQCIRIFLSLNDGKSEMEHFDYQRNDGYQTKIDAGFENLDIGHRYIFFIKSFNFSRIFKSFYSLTTTFLSPLHVKLT